MKQTLNLLGNNPPQVILFEGGNEEERLYFAKYWAARCNCKNALQNNIGPCLTCPTCLQILSGEYIDLLMYDGRISNTEDKENPSLFRALNKENIVALKQTLKDAQHGQGYRIVILMGLGLQRNSAANSLLKLLEEPLPTTLFVLLTPQRNQLLPTLVSRSFCITLPWKEMEEIKELNPLIEELELFFETGKGFLTAINQKGAMNITLAQNIIHIIQKAIINKMANEHNKLKFINNIPLYNIAKVNYWLNEAENMLANNVTPSRVIESLAMQIHVLGAN